MRLVELVHKVRVGHAVLADASVNLLNPESAGIALLLLTVPVAVLQCLVHTVEHRAPAVLRLAAVALGKGQVLCKLSAGHLYCPCCWLTQATFKNHQQEWRSTQIKPTTPSRRSSSTESALKEASLAVFIVCLFSSSRSPSLSQPLPPFKHPRRGVNNAYSRLSCISYSYTSLKTVRISTRW